MNKVIESLIYQLQKLEQRFHQAQYQNEQKPSQQLTINYDKKQECTLFTLNEEHNFNGKLIQCIVITTIVNQIKANEIKEELVQSLTKMLEETQTNTISLPLNYNSLWSTFSDGVQIIKQLEKKNLIFFGAFSLQDDENILIEVAEELKQTWGILIERRFLKEWKSLKTNDEFTFKLLSQLENGVDNYETKTAFENELSKSLPKNENLLNQYYHNNEYPSEKTNQEKQEFKEKEEVIPKENLMQTKVKLKNNEAKGYDQDQIQIMEDKIKSLKITLQNKKDAYQKLLIQNNSQRLPPSKNIAQDFKIIQEMLKEKEAIIQKLIQENKLSQSSQEKFQQLVQTKDKIIQQQIERKKKS